MYIYKPISKPWNSARAFSIFNSLTSSHVSPVEQQPLLSDPFKSDEVKRVRDTYNKFAKPNLISFDLFDTLYTPKSSISKQYNEIASKEFGINKSIEEIESKFPIIYKELQLKYPNWGKLNGITNSNEWWMKLIVQLFEIPHYDTDKNSLKLCQRLLTHFTSDQAYRVYDDVIPVLEELTKRNIKLVISTNSDDRVSKILESLNLSKYFETQDVHLSYNIGYTKPDKAFFDIVLDKYYLVEGKNKSKAHVPRSKFLEKCWHIGDRYDEDFVGSIKAGWNGVLIDRNRRSKFFNTEQLKQTKPEYEACFSELGQSDISDDKLRLIANNRVAATDLKEILRIFDTEPVESLEAGTHNII